MNKNRYRIVFNKSRGILMAVAENARSQGRGKQRGSDAGGTPALSFPRRLVAWITLVAYVGQPLAVMAQVVADPNAAGNKRPVVDTSANGLPLVQIATPNASGLSHNQYNQFNVDPKGAILNNSGTTVLTQQGGYVSGNPNLANGSARIILNEVTGPGASSLRGYTEVAGQRAEVIIANPNGISCDGCGFINASRGMLTTGSPVFGGSGSLDAFRVTGGQITVGSGGLNAGNVDQLDLISRSLQVNGQIWANNLNVITGSNQVNYANLGIQVIQGDANKPTVGIDVALLGGMYANKIKLIGTEAGVGVNSAGALAAQAGSFSIDSQGQITLTGSTTASGSLAITSAAGIGNTGNLYGKQDVQLTAQGNLNNSGTLAAQGNLTLTAASVNSSGNLGAGLDAGGNATQNANLTVNTSGNLNANGQNLAGNNIALNAAGISLANSRTRAGNTATLNATGAIDTGNGSVSAGNLISATAGTSLSNNSGNLSAAQLDLHASNLNNRAGKIVQSGTAATTVAVAGTLDNTGGTLQTSSANLSLTPQALINDGGTIAHAGAGTLTINTSGTTSNNTGSIATNGQLALNAASINNRGGSISQAGTADTRITTPSTGSGQAVLDNTGGRIVSNGLKLSMQLGSLTNDGGTIAHAGAGTLTINTSGTTSNNAGSIATNGQLALNAASLTNRGGSIVSTGRSDLAVSAATDNTSGLLQAGTALNANSGSLLNVGGRIVSLDASGMTLSTSGQLTNSNAGVIGGNGDVNVSAGSLANSATLLAQHNLTLRSTSTLDNSHGNASAGNLISATAGTSLSNNSGNLSAAQLDLHAADLNNRAGKIVQSGTAATTVAVTGTLDNTGGTLQTSSANLSLTPQTLINDGGTIAHAGAGTLTINTSGTTSNNAGSIATNGQLALSAASLANRSGSIVSTGRSDLAVSTATDNTGGLIQAGTALNANSGSLLNVGGRIVSLDASGMTLSTSGQLTNSNAGVIGGNGDVNVSAGSLANSATVLAQHNLTVQSSTALDNSQGSLSAGNLISATVGTSLSNNSGNLSAAQLDLHAADLNNRAGKIVQSGTAATTVAVTGTLDNTGGTLQTSSANLSLTPQTLINDGGTIAHAGAGALTINTTGATSNNAGSIATNGQLALNAASISNQGGSISAQKQAGLTSQGNIDNSRSGYIGADSLAISARTGAVDNSSNGTMEANTGLSIDSARLLNAAGLVHEIGSSALNLSVSQDIDNTSGRIVGNGSATLVAGSLDNSNGAVFARNDLTFLSRQLTATITGSSTPANSAPGTLTNNGGTIQTQGNLNLTMDGALANHGGTIEAGGGANMLTVSAASIDNNGGRITDKGTGAGSISTGALTNVGGVLGGNGDVSLSAATLNNSSNGLVMSGNNLNLSISSLTNSGGKVFAGGNLNYGYAGGVLDNSGGTVSSMKTGTYNLGAVYNTGGNITANTDINLTTGSLNGNGQVIANRDLITSLNGDYNYAPGTNLLGAGHNLTLTLPGTFVNSRTLEAPGTLTLNATSILNNGTLNAATTNVYASYITNNGYLYGDSINTSSYRFTNYATIIGNNIEMSGSFLTNVGTPAIIAATSNINLWTSNTLENSDGAEIYSLGDINIAANSSGARTQYVLNYGNNLTKSSLIEANVNLNITATTLDNKRAAIGVGQTTSTPTLQTLTRPPSTTITNGGFFVADITGGAPNTSAGTLTVGGSTIYYESVAPAPVAVVEYLKRAAPGGPLQISQLINQADIASSTSSTVARHVAGGRIQMVTTYTVKLTSGAVLYFDGIGRQGQYYHASYYAGYNPSVNLHPSQLRTLPHPNTVLNEYRRDLSTTTTSDVITSAVTQQALMRASGNINLNVGGTLTNYTSTIAAGNRLNIVGSTNNQALTLASTTTTTGTSYFDGGYSVGNGWGGSYWQADYGTSPLVPVSKTNYTTAYSSVLSGNQGAVIHAGVVKNSAGGNSTQIAGSTLGNTVNAASVASAGRSGVQGSNGGTGVPAVSGSSSAIQGAAGSGIQQLSPGQQSVQGAASVNLAPVALPTLTLPTSGLYTVHDQPGQKYLVETNKRFTDFKTFTGSDYLLGRLTINPQSVQKRLGDGFYEQKLISDQITELTGRRFTGKFTSVEDQTRALMDAAAGESKSLNLSLGIALSREQAAALTHDIVWMVSEQVTLPDGSTTTALVPRVYLSAQHSVELKPDGALIAGDVVDINATTVDNSGTVSAAQFGMVKARDILNTGKIASSGDLLLRADHDISNVSGSIAGKRVALNAGHDIINTTATSTVTDSRQALAPSVVQGDGIFGGLKAMAPTLQTVASASNTVVGATGTISATDSLSLEAGNDILLKAARLSSGGDASMKAGHDIAVGTVAAEAGSHSSIGGNFNTAQTTQLTSAIQTGGNLAMKSGNDLHLTSAMLDAGGNASLVSGGNLTIDAAKNILSHDDSSGLNINRAYDETVLGANLKTGGNLTLAATNGSGNGKGNLNLLSANLSSDTGRLTLLADNNVNIGTTQENHSSFVQSYSESSGFMSSSSTLSRTETHQSLAVGSSLAGDSIVIKAGKADAKTGDPSTTLRTGDINVVGSSIAGTHDVTLDAERDINILAATSTSTYSSYSHTTENGFMSNGGMSFTYGSRETTDKFDSTQSLQSQNRSLVGSTSGNLTLKAGRNALISGSDIVAAQDINIAARDITINSGLDNSTSRQEHDQKQSGLTVAVSVGAVNTAQTVNQMGQAFSQSKNDRTKALALMAGGMAAMNGMGGMKDVSASATVGSSESHSDTTQTSTKNSGSKINAGGNLNLVATAENGQGGNITILGSDIKAGKDMTLAADNNIALLADQDTSSQVSHNSSSSSGAGVSVSNTTGPGVTANASMSRGNSDGHDVTNINTHIDAGNTLRIKSGNDTTLKGATVSGKQIVADIGGNLSIESLQDTSTYNSKQESASASVTVGMSGGSGSVNASQSKINGNYASVKEQSGLKAGDGGFQVNVKGNTNLKGAVIESTQAATDNGSNSFTTGTLTTSDIHNVAEYDAQSVSVGASTSGVSLPAVMGADGKNESTTRSGISGATIKITDETKQKQLTGKDAKETVASINTDVKTGKDTSGAIGNNLDVAEIQTGFAVTQTFVQQAGTLVANLAAKSDNLKAAGDAKKAAAEKETDPARKQQLAAEADKLYQQSDATAADSKLWQPGGTYRQIATALTAAAGGNVTGGMGQLVQGAAVNYIQSLGVEKVKAIADSFQKDGKNTPESESVRAALHGILACAGASAQGGDCSSGALGASAGSVINSLMGGDPAKMTAKEKEDRKNLVTSLVAGIATATGAQASTATSAAQMETENNYLKPHEIVATEEKLRLLQGDKAAQKVVIDEAQKKSEANDKALQSDCAANPNSAACQKHVQDALNYAGDQNATSGISGAMGEDIKRSRTVVLDQTLNGGSYSAVNNIETRADFFGAMKQQTGAPWFKTSEDVSRNDLQSIGIPIGDALNNGQVSAWRDTAGNEIMKHGADNFRSIYNNPNQDVNKWSVNQLSNEQNDPKLQGIHQQYFPNFNSLTQYSINTLGGVKDLLNPVERIKTGCVKMGMLENCGASQ